MRTDDDLLAHVRREAGRRRRRRQAVAGAVAVVLVVGIGAVAAAVVGGEGPERVRSVDAPTTTTEVVTTTTTGDLDATTTTPTPTSAPTTSTTAPPATTTTTAPPVVATTLPPLEPQVFVAEVDGLTVTLTATQDRARPGVVVLDVRVQAPRGSDPGGYVRWKPGEMEDYWGRAADGPLDCQEVIDGVPLEPDPSAGPVDRTFRLEHDYGATGRVVLEARASVSFCTTDGISVASSWEMQVGG